VLEVAQIWRRPCRTFVLPSTKPGPVCYSRQDCHWRNRAVAIRSAEVATRSSHAAGRAESQGSRRQNRTGGPRISERRDAADKQRSDPIVTDQGRPRAARILRTAARNHRLLTGADRYLAELASSFVTARVADDETALSAVSGTAAVRVPADVFG
jgi:hypothetical protein